MAKIDSKSARHVVFRDVEQNAQVWYEAVKDWPIGCVTIATHGGVCRLNAANMRLLAGKLLGWAAEIEAVRKPRKPGTDPG